MKSYSGKKLQALSAGIFILLLCVHLTTYTRYFIHRQLKSLAQRDMPYKKLADWQFNYERSSLIAKQKNARNETIKHVKRLSRDNQYNFSKGKFSQEQLNFDSTTNRIHCFQSGCCNCKQHNFSEPLKGTDSIQCVPSSTDPPVKICVYDAIEDAFISTSIIQKGIWEANIHKNIMDILSVSATENIGFIDIGANIGSHSLPVAKAGYQVLAVEPVSDNVKYIHKSVLLNRLQDYFTLLENAVSNTRSTMQHSFAGDNRGHYEMMEHQNGTISSILLDDLLYFTKFDKAILKMDIEGMEHKAILYAEKLLRQLNIPVIFMEWGQLRQWYNYHGSPDKDIIIKMLKILDSNKYVAYSQDNNQQLNMSTWGLWPFDIKFLKQFC